MKKEKTKMSRDLYKLNRMDKSVLGFTTLLIGAALAIQFLQISPKFFIIIYICSLLCLLGNYIDLLRLKSIPAEKFYLHTGLLFSMFLSFPKNIF